MFYYMLIPAKAFKYAGFCVPKWPYLFMVHYAFDINENCFADDFWVC